MVYVGLCWCMLVYWGHSWGHLSIDYSLIPSRGVYHKIKLSWLSTNSAVWGGPFMRGEILEVAKPLQLMVWYLNIWPIETINRLRLQTSMNHSSFRLDIKYIQIPPIYIPLKTSISNTFQDQIKMLILSSGDIRFTSFYIRERVLMA